MSMHNIIADIRWNANVIFWNNGYKNGDYYQVIIWQVFFWKWGGGGADRILIKDICQ